MIHRNLFLGLFLFFTLPVSLSSQKINSWIVPQYLSPFTVRDLYVHPIYSRVYLTGSRDFVLYEDVDSKGGYNKITSLSFDSYFFGVPAYIPDSLYYSYYSFGGHNKRYAFSYVVDSFSNEYIAWYSQFNTYDCTTAKFFAPTLHFGKRSGSDYSELFTEYRAMNPKLYLGINNNKYLVWESVEPVDIDSNYISYKSKLYFRELSENNKLGPVREIGSGYTSKMFIEQDGTMHFIWLDGAVSPQSYPKGQKYSLKYRYSVGDSLSQIQTLKDSLYRPANLYLYVDKLHMKRIAWTEEVLQSNSLTRSKIFCMRYEGGKSIIDTSNLCQSYSVEMKYIFIQDTICAAIWSDHDNASPSKRFISYSDNRSSSIFQHVNTFRSTDYYYFYVVRRENGSVDCFLSYDKISYLPSLEKGMDSSRIIMQTTGENYDLYAAAIDPANQIWLLYNHSSPHDAYRKEPWLARLDFTPTDVNDGLSIPNAITLYQNYPNPFSTSTAISYRLPAIGHVRLEVLDIFGRTIATLVDEEKDAGEYSAKYSVGRFAEVRSMRFEVHQGVYFYRLTVGKNVLTRKMIVMQ